MVASPEDRQRIERLMRVADVLARMARLVEPVLPRQVQPAVALGATLADDIIVATERPTAPLALIARWILATEAGDLVAGDFPGWLAELLCLE